MRRLSLVAVVIALASTVVLGQGRGQGRGGGGGGQNAASYVIRPARVFDGDAMHEGWAVVVNGQRITAAGPAASVTAPDTTASKE